MHGCSNPVGEGGSQRQPSREIDKIDKSDGSPRRVGRDAVRDLPFSQGRSFSTLDEYLAFLEQRGRYDVPWYREVRPGLYEVVARRGPGAAPLFFTREELERRFGFAR